MRTNKLSDVVFCNIYKKFGTTFTCQICKKYNAHFW